MISASVLAGFACLDGRGRVQFHDILYTMFRDILYTPRVVVPARGRRLIG